MNVTSLSMKELNETNGGIIGLLIAYIVIEGGLGLLYGNLFLSFQKGYDQAMQE